MVEYRTTEYRTANYIARIHRPILSDEERKVREAAIKEAMVAVYKERMNNNDNQN